MRIKTKNTVKVEGDYYPPHTELDLPEEVARDLAAAGAAEILEQAAAETEPQTPEPEGGPAPKETGIDPALLEAVRRVIRAGEGDPSLLTKDRRPKVSAVAKELGAEVSANDIQAALEAIEAEERR